MKCCQLKKQLNVYSVCFMAKFEIGHLYGCSIHISTLTFYCYGKYIIIVEIWANEHKRCLNFQFHQFNIHTDESARNN